MRALKWRTMARVKRIRRSPETEIHGNYGRGVVYACESVCAQSGRTCACMWAMDGDVTMWGGEGESIPELSAKWSPLYGRVCVFV